MAVKRQPWNIRPLRKPASPLTDSTKREVESAAEKLIDNVLKPRHIPAPKRDQEFNYITDFRTKWHRHFFYLIAIYTCPDPNAFEPTFDEHFARLEYLGRDRFALYHRRYNGEWVGILDGLYLDEAFDSIKNDPWFEL